MKYQCHCAQQLNTIYLTYGKIRLILYTVWGLASSEVLWGLGIISFQVFGHLRSSSIRLRLPTMNYSPIIKILTLQSSIKINEIKSFYFKLRLSKTTCLTQNNFLFFPLCTGHRRNIKINESTYRLYRYQHVEVDSFLFVSERICGVRCRKLCHSVFTFTFCL